MRNQRKSFLLLIILCVLLYSTVGFAAPVASCITCHTNEPIMKALHKPPLLPPSEGEG